jgi:hypothetical protein
VTKRRPWLRIISGGRRCAFGTSRTYRLDASSRREPPSDTMPRLRPSLLRTTSGGSSSRRSLERSCPSWHSSDSNLLTPLVAAHDRKSATLSRCRFRRNLRIRPQGGTSRRPAMNFSRSGPVRQYLIFRTFGNNSFRYWRAHARMDTRHPWRTAQDNVHSNKTVKNNTGLRKMRCPPLCAL